MVGNRPGALPQPKDPLLTLLNRPRVSTHLTRGTGLGGARAGARGAGAGGAGRPEPRSRLERAARKKSDEHSVCGVEEVDYDNCFIVSSESCLCVCMCRLVGERGSVWLVRRAYVCMVGGGIKISTLALEKEKKKTCNVRWREKKRKT